jgi:hypothetical protein
MTQGDEGVLKLAYTYTSSTSECIACLGFSRRSLLYVLGTPPVCGWCPTRLTPEILYPLSGSRIESQEKLGSAGVAGNPAASGAVGQEPSRTILITTGALDARRTRVAPQEPQPILILRWLNWRGTG